MKNEKKDRAQHVCDSLSLVESLTWQEWKKLWLKPVHKVFETLEFRMSMLHFGFKLSADGPDEIDRIKFYLDLADRYDQRELFFGDSRFADNGEHIFTSAGYVSQGELRSILACQAFKCLCEGFFKKDSEHGYYQAIRLSVTEELFTKMLWFFRRRSPGVINNTNDNPIGLQFVSMHISDHNLKTIRGFLQHFCQVAWDYRDYARYHDDSDKVENQKIHDRLRINLIEIVDLMERLDMLYVMLMDQCLCDSETCEVLVKRVLDSVDVPVPEKSSPGIHVLRDPVSLEEASAYGSCLASTLILVRAKLKHRKSE